MNFLEAMREANGKDVCLRPIFWRGKRHAYYMRDGVLHVMYSWISPDGKSLRTDSYEESPQINFMIDAQGHFVKWEVAPKDAVLDELRKEVAVGRHHV